LIFFEEFLRHYDSEFSILQISSTSTMGKRSRLQMLKELRALYGTAGIAKLLGEVGYSRILGKFPKTRDAARFYTLEQIARSHEIPYRKIGNPNAPNFIDTVREREADVIVSVACPYILKSALLSLPRRGAINIHHAPLPKYKGMMPTFWQMFHGEPTVGVTVHFMAAKVDEGAALLQEQLAIEPNETLDHLIRRSKRHGAHCMAKALRQVASASQQNIELKPQNGSYFSFPSLEDIREFHRKGLRAI